MAQPSTTNPNPEQDPQNTTVSGQPPLEASNPSRFGVGQNELYSDRAKTRNNSRFAYRGPDLSYPKNILDIVNENTAASAQGTYIQFNVFKRQSQRADIDTSVSAENPLLFEVGVGFFDENNQRTGGLDAGRAIRQSNYAFGQVLTGSNQVATNLQDGGDKFNVNAVKADQTFFGNDGFLGYNDFATGGQSRQFTPDQLRKRQKTVASDIRLSKASEKLEETIRLYMPGNLTVNDSVEYEETTAGGFNDINELIAGNAGALGERIGLSAVNTISGIAGAAPGIGGDDAANFLRARLGIAQNPRNESLFKGTTRRAFQFAFTFAPRSQEEALIMMNIIEAFRFHMMPELSLGGNMLLAPHEFGISFMTLNSERTADGTFSRATEFVENKNLPKIGRAFLESANTEFAPNERSAFFYDGIPTEIKLTLNFKQAFLPNRQFILEGF